MLATATLDEIMESTLVKIDVNRKYWLVRTQSGDYYDEFYHGNFIGIGWNKLNEIDFTTTDEKLVVDLIRKIDEEERMPGLVYSQLKRFSVEMKPGDIVLIPSKSSAWISFGEIESDAYIEPVSEDDVLEGLCPFEKRRKVRWIKSVEKDALDPYLYKLLNSHHTISDATSGYAHIIDRTLHSFFIKGEAAHLLLRVTTEDKVAAVDVLNLINDTLDLVPLVREISDVEMDPNDVELKISVQSPGPVELIALTALGVTALGLLVVFVVGGKHKFSFNATQEKVTANHEIATEGILEKIMKMRKNKHEQKLSEMEARAKILKDKLGLELPPELKSVEEAIDWLKSQTE